ncbi:MAG: urease [Campylobacteraceae bacterium]|jgi:urease accessory protein|nr:urease [Campylobacteraceae bacterium]
MPYPTIHTEALLKFIQILDSSFPSGTFTHSFGLEPHAVLGIVKNAKDLKRFLENIIMYQYAKMEFPTVAKVYKYAKSSSLSLLLKLDIQFSSMYCHAFAKAYKTIGENCFSHLKDLKLNKDITKLYFESIKADKTPCSEIVLLSVFAYDLDMCKEDFMLFWSKKNLINIAAASLKISKIKPSEAQQILFLMDDFLREHTKNIDANPSNFNPFFDSIIYMHKNIEPRLFMT